MTGFGSKLARAVVVGVATIFQRKPEEDQHWSEPPTVPVDDETEADESGDPPLPSGGMTDTQRAPGARRANPPRASGAGAE